MAHHGKRGEMEEFISWRDDWRLGIQLLDEQHRLLADCLNRLARQCSCTEAGDPGDREEVRRRLGKLLDELYSTAKQHFKKEEALMLEQDYPGYASHLREHVMLLAELKSTFISQFEQGCCQMDPAVFKALRSWFIVHVIRSDREFADFIRNRAKQ
jgi:hemerythrin